MIIDGFCCGYYSSKKNVRPVGIAEKRLGTNEVFSKRRRHDANQQQKQTDQPKPPKRTSVEQAQKPEEKCKTKCSIYVENLYDNKKRMRRKETTSMKIEKENISLFLTDQLKLT